MKSLDKLESESKVWWLMKCGVRACLKVVAAMKVIPATLTEDQTRMYVCSMVNELEPSDAEAIHNFLSNFCESMVNAVESSFSVNGTRVLAPPVW